jgi:hypothetical protein
MANVLIVFVVALGRRAYFWQSHYNARAFNCSVPLRLNHSERERPVRHDAGVGCSVRRVRCGQYFKVLSLKFPHAQEVPVLMNK